MCVYLSYFQAKYKEAGKKEASSCLYSLLPATLETQLAKESSELLSEVRTASNMCKQAGKQTKMSDLMFLMQISQVKYKESAKKEMSAALYSTLPETLETSFSREMSDVLSEVPKPQKPSPDIKPSLLFYHFIILTYKKLTIIPATSCSFISSSSVINAASQLLIIHRDDQRGYLKFQTFLIKTLKLLR